MLVVVVVAQELKQAHSSLLLRTPQIHRPPHAIPIPVDLVKVALLQIVAEHQARHAPLHRPALLIERIHHVEGQVRRPALGAAALGRAEVGREAVVEARVETALEQLVGRVADDVLVVGREVVRIERRERGGGR